MGLTGKSVFCYYPFRCGNNILNFLRTAPFKNSTCELFLLNLILFLLDFNIQSVHHFVEGSTKIKIFCTYVSL